MWPARLTIDVSGADDREIERLTGLLRTDLITLGLLSVQRANRPAPDDAKSAGQLAELVLTGTFSVSTVSAVARVITTHIQRTRTRSVTWQQGDKNVTFTGISADDQRRLVEALADDSAKNDAKNVAKNDGDAIAG
jgi:hypothetical protein